MSVFIETEKQNDNLAKFFYDIAKIDFAAFGISQFTRLSEFSILSLIMGILSIIVPLIVALSLDGREVEK